MAEPKAVWSLRRVITDNSISLSQNIILSYAEHALRTVINRIDALHGLVATFLSDQPAPELPALLSEIAFNQGLASLILFSDGQRRKGEKDANYKGRTERAAHVLKKCGTENLSTLKNRKIRNSIVHLDEYLTDALSAQETGWFVDMAVRTREELGNKDVPNVMFCRSYIMSTDTLLHLGYEAHLSELRRECDFVLKVLWPLDEAGRPLPHKGL